MTDRRDALGEGTAVLLDPAPAAADVVPPVPRRSLGWRTLDTAAALSWRLLLVVAALWVAVKVLAAVWLAVLPLIGAFFVTVALWPIRSFLIRRGTPRLLATWIAFLAPFLMIAGLVAVTLPAARNQFQDLDETIRTGLEDVRAWAVGSPLNLSEERVDAVSDTITREVRTFAEGPRVRTFARTAAEVVAGIALALVMMFFFLKDGERIKAWTLERVPSRRRAEVARLGDAAWSAVRGYLKGTAIIGSIEGLFVLVLLLILGVPLAIPLGIVTLFGAFFPLVGAVVAGALSVIVTLATVGPGKALIVLVAIVVLQQLDGDILQPVVMGGAVRLHPVIILLALTAGGLVGGIVGAFLAVPTTAVVWAMSQEWRRSRRTEQLGVDPRSPPPPEVSV